MEKLIYLSVNISLNSVIKWTGPEPDEQDVYIFSNLIIFLFSHNFMILINQLELLNSV